MWYLVVDGLLALWVFLDAFSRRSSAWLLWCLGTFLLAGIVVPIYLAVRPLRAGETREGGKAWNILRGFALTWTVIMAALGVSAIYTLSNNGQAQTTTAGSVVYAIGSAIGIGLIAMAWFFPMVGALVLGFFLRNAAVIEQGPTGRLASEFDEMLSAGDYASPDQPTALSGGRLTCPACGHRNSRNRVTCKECRRPLHVADAEMAIEPTERTV